jgi:SpoVK/Ycf46/Vps4 family AAA+-type ATPase
MTSVVGGNLVETEKNISRIFKKNETNSAILFFDDADILFGKRSDIKDYYFGYTNFEIDYMLQELYEHNEIVILASNIAKNIDDNIISKMHFRIDFQFPDEESRFRIWKNIFPKICPLSNDVDLKFLAKQFRLTGGNIKNISLSAAFLAAEDAEPRSISMKHIVKATKRELDKIGKPYKRTDFGKYYEFIVNETSG